MEDVEDVPNRLINNRYELLERIGGGSMGEVWRGRDLVLGRPVAVKIVLPMLLEVPTFRERFAAEALVMARIEHDGVVDVFDYGVTAGPDGRDSAYMVMEFVEGETLDHVLRGRGPLDHVAALDVLGQLLDALGAVHRQGIVHRDIKPANVMVRNGHVVLADFGIARSQEASGLTADDTLLGTVPYLAPELFKNEEITTAVDVYAVGILGYELLAGRPPFRGDSTAAVMYMHVYEPPPPLPDHVPGSVVSVLWRALSKRPEERWPDAAQMAAAVRAAVSEDEYPAPGQGLNPEPVLRSRTGGTRPLPVVSPGSPSTALMKYEPPTPPSKGNPRILVPAVAAGATLLIATAAVLMSGGSSSGNQTPTGKVTGAVVTGGTSTIGGLPYPSASGLGPTTSNSAHRTHTSGTGTPTNVHSTMKSGTPGATTPTGSGTPVGTPTKPSGTPTDSTTPTMTTTAATTTTTSAPVTSTTTKATTPGPTSPSAPTPSH